MSARLEPNYQPLQPFPSESGDQEETPQDSGLIIHVVPENGRARWNHIEDLDSFFARMYNYHQKHGFACMVLQETLELGQFIFVVLFSTFLFHCIDYSILFREDPKIDNNQKISLGDAMLPANECVESFGVLTWICLFVALIFWALRFLKAMYHLFHYWDIKEFFNSALKIKDSDLDNLTWHEIQRRVREVQREQQMCIHKAELTELDIYHRILRFKNYTVAMVNKSMLPVKLQFPYLGHIIFFTRGLKYNIELLLFWGPWAPFENNWHLKQDYKKVAKRKELAQELSKHILWVGVINLVMCPLVFLWQILYFFFSYGEVIKREPGSLGLRSWSLYGRLYLRHFNELDHELNARLNRAYRPAAKYMNIFTSPLLAVIAGNLYFMCGAVLAVLLALTVYDEDVLTVEHVLTIMTGLGVVAAGCRVFIPDENLVWCPEKLLLAVLADIHYSPDSWKGLAHTHKVRDEFSQLFQYKAVYVLQELLSPLLTPFIIIFHLRPRALDIIDFLRNFTVEVVGVGDVCSFAQMDIRRHGNPTWHASGMSYPSEPGVNMQAEDGKTELSLLHFMFTNPEWKAPVEAQNFVTTFRNQARKDAANPLYSSMYSLGAGRGLAESTIGFHPPFATTSVQTNVLQSSGGDEASTVRGGLSRAEGPVRTHERGLLYALQQGLPTNSLGASVFGQGGDIIQQTEPVESMSLSALYLHELHRRQVHVPSYNVWQRPQDEEIWYSSPQSEKAPLIETPGK